VSPASRIGGFTLVELLLGMALTVLVVALTMPFAHAQKRLWERAEERREANRALAGALLWLTRDLQQAGYHSPDPPLRLISEDSLSYVVSRDEDEPSGFSAENRRLITVWLDGGDLKYRVQAPLAAPATGWESGSTQVLASGIGSAGFRAFDAGGEPTADTTLARLVECTLRGTSGVGESALVRLRPGWGEAAP